MAGRSIEITDDGSATLRSPVHGDTYHSLRGAVGEARHVFIEAGFRAVVENYPLSGKRSTRAEGEGEVVGIRILEAGFGTGLNAWLTLLETEGSSHPLDGCLEEAVWNSPPVEGWRRSRRGGLRQVEYTSVELYPVPEEVAVRLGYTDDVRFMAMHRAPWGVRADISEGFRLTKLHADLVVTEISGSFDLVYYDAFAPDTQPELWTPEIFARIFAAMADGGVLVTYSAKGDVRRALQSAGFTVEKLPGALGKRHMLRARKI